MKVFILTIFCFQAALLVLASNPLFNSQDEAEIDCSPIELVTNRTGMIDTRYRWTNNIIPYEIVDLTAAQAASVREALDEMEAALCVAFVPRTTETNYVQVTNSGSGCFSYVGMLGGAQILNLASGCYRKGSIMHLFILSLGLRGMHRAYDRDNYIKIVWEHIRPGYEQNFDTVNPDRYDQFEVPYDYGSVMHYSTVSFSVNGRPTIATLDPNAVIGQRIGMSAYDILRIRNMYCP